VEVRNDMVGHNIFTLGSNRGGRNRYDAAKSNLLRNLTGGFGRFLEPPSR
jgi:hypothetical protein